MPETRPNWQMVLGAVGLVLAIMGGLWSITDPRGDIKDIRTNYLSLREHEEFVRRFNSDLGKVESTAREMPRRAEVDAHMKQLGDRLTAMQAQIDLLISRSLIQPPPNASK